MILCQHCRGEATQAIAVDGRTFHYCDKCTKELLDYLELKYNRGLSD